VLRVLLKGIHTKQRLDWGAPLAGSHLHQVKVAGVQLRVCGILILGIDLTCAEWTVVLTLINILCLFLWISFTNQLPFLSGNDDVLVTVPALFGRAVDSAAGVDDITDKVPIRCVGRRHDGEVQRQLK
jgi:hypothetical protein